jgi:OOP family OmpA-OmpF porin
MGPKISENMGDDIRDALHNAGSEWADVEMNGHIATITGVAPSNDAARNAIEVAQNTVCSDCNAEAPWHRVLNGTKTAEVKVVKIDPVTVQSPYTFSVLKSEDGAVTLSGYVNNVDERNALISKAKSTFSSSIKDETIKIASGAPDENWLNVIQSGMDELALMENGRFQIEDNNFLINGTVTSPDVRDQINQMSATLSENYNGAANINVPNFASDAVGEVKSKSICQSLFDDLNQGEKITFATGGSRITGNSSFDLLAEIASAATQCQSFRIQIDGYTDNVGDETKNQLLSEQRANGVLAYLTEQGVDRGRMTAKGHGASNPIGDNATAEGREMNRRTAFTLTQDQ